MCKNFKWTCFILSISHYTYHKLVSDEDSSQNFEEFQCWTAEKVNVLLKTADIGAHLFAVTWRTYCSRGRNPPRFNQLLTLDCCCCSRKRILPPSLMYSVVPGWNNTVLCTLNEYHSPPPSPVRVLCGPWLNEYNPNTVLCTLNEYHSPPPLPCMSTLRSLAEWIYNTYNQGREWQLAATTEIFH